MVLMSVYWINIALPAHPVIMLMFAAVGVFILVRLAGRIIEMLPG